MYVSFKVMKLTRKYKIKKSDVEEILSNYELGKLNSFD